MDVIILEIKDVKGNCEIDKHQGQIIVESFSHGMHIPLSADVANTERTTGRPVFTEMTFSKAADMSTPILYAACSEGKKLGDAKIHIGRNENGKFMSVVEYVLSNAMVSTISTSGGGNGRVPMDSFSLNFTKITQEFTQQKTDSTKKGTATFGWDLATNKAA